MRKDLPVWSDTSLKVKNSYIMNKRNIHHSKDWEHQI